MNYFNFKQQNAIKCIPPTGKSYSVCIAFPEKITVVTLKAYSKREQIRMFMQF